MDRLLVQDQPRVELEGREEYVCEMAGRLEPAENEGVAGQVKQIANSIGYVELIFALQTKMSYGKS